jgi:hypothetical protein|tara:strand:- start:238 stop:711 length:474 start_codon:yes stop_codon:yes gene_type:complete
MAITINGTSNGKINNTSFSTTTGNAVTTGDSGTVTALMLNGGQTGSAPAFGVRSWVRFSGTGTIAIEGSGNVSSLTDNGTGDYTINFTTAMPNANYTIATSVMGFAPTSSRACIVTWKNSSVPATAPQTSSARVQCKITENSFTLFDFELISVVAVG